MARKYITPFQVGDFVYYGTHPGTCNMMYRWTPGVVLGITAKGRFRVRFTDGKTRTLTGDYLAWGGWCPACECTAVARPTDAGISAPWCPTCQQPTPQPPSGDVVAIRYRYGEMLPFLLYEAIVHGATTMDTARAAARAHRPNDPRHAEEQARAKEFSDRWFADYEARKRAAEKNRVLSFLELLATYLDDEADSLPAQSLPFGWTDAPAVDQEPTQQAEPIDLGNWLEAQMRRKAA